MDSLTGLLTRRAWEELVVRQHEVAERYGRPYSVLMIDVDHLKAYNDAYGHQAGDECLYRIARAMESVCRRADCLGRYGEETFAVLAPETDGAKAFRLADRIHRAIWALAIPHSAATSPARITASIGVAVSSARPWEQVLARADAALLVAKRAGRNMVYLDPDTDTAVEPEAACEKQPPADNEANEQIEVLVVDDDPTNRAVCKGCLRRTGYRIREAQDGVDALEKVREHAPDVIIMDVMMPNMDGLECTRALRADAETRDIPIIVVSALSRTEDILAGLQAGADEYISKPIRSSELMLRVQSMARLNRERIDLLRSYEQRGRQMRILTRLVEFCRAIGVCKASEEILQQTVSAVADVMDCRRVSVMLPDAAEESLNIVSSIGLDRDLARTVRVRLGAPIAGEVFASGRPIVVNSTLEAGACGNDYSAPYFASIPLVSAPLDAAGRVVGVLNATEKAGGTPFETRDLEYIELISKVAGTALHDLRMREAHDQASDSIMVGLASLAECRDTDTGKHLDRVTQFCLLLARALRETEQYAEQIEDEFLYNLERAVPLHDIGKVAIPDGILQKPGKLTEDEMKIMRTHAEVGASTIESLMARAPGVCFLEMARDIARHHHERYDGCGYPDGLAGRRIPLAARIAAVADVYDALTTKRVYKEAFSHAKASAIIIEGSGTAFDPDVVEGFIQQEQAIAALAEALADVVPHTNGPAAPPAQAAQPVLSAG
jgi:putative two-component system response regulator